MLKTLMAIINLLMTKRRDWLSLSLKVRARQPPLQGTDILVTESLLTVPIFEMCYNHPKS